MIKVSDYVMKYLVELGIDKVFFISGGGAMHLNDSLGRQDGLEGVCMIHEQGASIAAEAYARVHEGYGACLVTSGPGATNALTGLVGAYIDSIPVIFISGQVKRDDLRDTQHVRQFGIQEVDIISMVSSYTKYAVQVKEPEDIRYELEKATAIAVDRRPGPVWIDIPLDIQASMVDEDTMQSYAELKKTYPVGEEDIEKSIEAINRAKRPVLVLGHGIRLSHSTKLARKLYNSLDIPVLVSWNGVDLIEDTHPLYYGRPGSVGHRAANFILQSADLVITLGTRLNLLSTGYNYDSFLSNAFHIMVDIDENEMNKKNVHPQLKIACDVADYMQKLLDSSDRIVKEDYAEWKAYCRMLKDKYPVFIPEQAAREGYVSSYSLLDKISDYMKPDDIYQFTSSGTTVDIAMKAVRLKWGQRAFLTKGLASMGYDIPASIGSCIASGRRTICVTGDGSAAMNMQELEVIKRRNLPIKIFVADNQGYSMIYGSQNGNFQGRLTGCTKESGLSLPDMKSIAEAFGIKGMHIDNEEEAEATLKAAMDYDGPVVCTYKADITQKILPRQANYMDKNGMMASRPLDDMAPLLDEEEINSIRKRARGE